MDGFSEVCLFMLLQKVQHELLTTYENQLLEKEHSGAHALLRDDKVIIIASIFARGPSCNISRICHEPAALSSNERGPSTSTLESHLPELVLIKKL